MLERVSVFGAVRVAAVTAVLVPSAMAQEQRPPVAPSPPKDASTPAKPTPATATEPTPSITVKDGRMTVYVENRPLEWVLEEISRKASLAIVRGGSVGSERVSARFRDLPLDEGLRQILSEHDAFFFYGVWKKSTAALRVVWVYPKGRGQGLAPVPPEEWASTEELQREVRTNPDPAARAQAVEALVERKRDGARDVVLGALQDSDDEVRTRALYGALSAGVTLPADSLAAMALNDQSSKVRFLALEVLAVDPGTVDLRAIAEQARNDPNPLLRKKAEEILGRFNRVNRPVPPPVQ